MRLPRIHTQRTLHVDREFELDARAAHYVRQVLRLKPGARLILFDGHGRDFEAVLQQADRNGARVRTSVAGPAEAEAALQAHLVIGISRGERMDFALQKAVELGVQEITPLFTARSVVSLRGERLAKRVQHWEAVVVSACEQSGRRRLPRFNTPTGLTAWLAGTVVRGILLDPAAARGLAALERPAGPFSILAGPEGGLDATECADACAAGLRPVRLGPRILRTETAPLAALAAAQVLWGDLGGA